MSGKAAKNGSQAPQPRTRGRLASYWSLSTQAFSAWQNDYAASMGAAISFYTVFSIAPLLVIVIAVAGLAFDAAVAQQQIVLQIRELVGESGARAVQELLKSASDPARSGIAAVIGVGTLLVGATSVFSELQTSLDRIWQVPPATKGGLWLLVRTRLLSFGMILGIGFLLAVSLLLSAGLAAIGSWWGGVFGGWTVALKIINTSFSFAVVTVLFAMIFKFLPRASIAWRDVWTGALVTAALFEFGKELIGLYLGTSGVTTTYGAAASLAVLMLWVYYSALVFLLGAEFTRAYALEYGTHREVELPRALVRP